jgi:hypothetical protein
LTRRRSLLGITCNSGGLCSARGRLRRHRRASRSRRYRSAARERRNRRTSRSGGYRSTTR